MLISQKAHGDSSDGHGSQHLSLAELRDQLSEPSTLSDGHRQRLLELVRRLERVQALGDEYSRVELSPSATTAAWEAQEAQA